MPIFVDEIGGKGCVLCLPLNEGSGTTVHDISGYGNNGTISGATWVNGRYGKALSFDGVDDYVEVPHSASLEPTDVTVEMWINPVSWTHTSMAVALVTKRTDTTNGFFIFWYADTGTINWDWGGNSYRWNTGYSPPLNTWTHLTFTRDSAGRKLYVNGVLRASTSNAGASVATGSVLRIGADSMAARYWFKGTIDAVRIYNRALSEEEIKAIYKGARFAPFR